MNKHFHNKGMLEVNSSEVGEISGEMLAKRAEELALIAGRPVTRADNDQAVRELTGGEQMNAKQALLESASEDERWDPIPGSTGHQAEESAIEDENEDGQSESAQLSEEGANEALHNQMLQAAMAKREEGSSGS